MDAVGRQATDWPHPMGDPLSDRWNTIDALAKVMTRDDRFDHKPTWADCWNAARIAYDQGWRPPAASKAVDR